MSVYKELNVEKDLSSEQSIYRFYQKLIALRKTPEYEEILVDGNTKPRYMEEDAVFAYERVAKNDKDRILILSNYQNVSHKVKIDSSYKNVLLNNYEHLEIVNGEICLKPYQTVVMK